MSNNTTNKLQQEREKLNKTIQLLDQATESLFSDDSSVKKPKAPKSMLAKIAEKVHEKRKQELEKKLEEAYEKFLDAKIDAETQIAKVREEMDKKEIEILQACDKQAQSLFQMIERFQSDSAVINKQNNTEASADESAQ